MRKILSEVNCAYLAGLIDGDGAIMAWIEKHKEKKFGYRVRVSVKITQNKKAVLEWCKKVCGFGHIRFDRSQFAWHSCDQKAIEYFLARLLPYLRVKKMQAERAIKIINTDIKSKKGLVRLAQRADALSKLNVRSCGRRKNFATMIQDNISPND